MVSPSFVDSDSDGEDDWEEVDVPQPEEPHIEITLNARPNKRESDEAAKCAPSPLRQYNSDLSFTRRKRAASLADRRLRIACHKLHTLCLMLNARIRNEWTNDPLLHVRLPSVPTADNPEIHSLSLSFCAYRLVYCHSHRYPCKTRSLSFTNLASPIRATVVTYSKAPSYNWSTGGLRHTSK